MNPTNLWNRAIKHSIFNRSVDGAPGAMRQAVRPFGQPRSAPPQPCPVRRDPRGCSSPFPRRASLWRRLRPRDNAATLLRGARACLALLAAAALLALAAPAQAQTEVWTATLTPADLSGGILGCSTSVSTARCSSTSVLSEDSFNYDSTDYNITVLLLRPDGRSNSSSTPNSPPTPPPTSPSWSAAPPSSSPMAVSPSKRGPGPALASP